MNSKKDEFQEIDKLLFDYYKDKNEVPKSTKEMLKNIKYKRKNKLFNIKSSSNSNYINDTNNRTGICK